jgi:adenylate cyclase
MGTEIERKFRVHGEGWREGRATRLTQGYLCAGPPTAVRARIAGDQAWLNIKHATIDISRLEYEYPIPVSDAQEMLDSLTQGALIDKTRHVLDYGGKTWEVDEFHGANAGLVVAELELNDAGEQFERPPWLGEEVSDDPRYLNAYLCQHPYTEW